MSENVHYKGKLTLVPKEGYEDLETLCRRIYNKLLPDCYDSFQEAIKDDFYKEYYIRNNNLYEVEYSEVEDSSVFNADKLGDGNIKFEIAYYNGGCSFNEALDIAIDNINK